MQNRRIFKSWVPQWLTFLAIFITLLPVASVMGIYMGGMQSAMSYYGVDSIDIRYSVVVYYLAIAGAFPLEKRFFNALSSKPYLAMVSLIYILVNIVLYNTTSFSILLIFRFIGGMLSLGFIGVLFNLLFAQFQEQRSRVLGYATLYATLFSTLPFAYILDAFVFTNFNFNMIFIFKIYLFLPGIILMFIILRPDLDLRKQRKIPLVNVDWKSFVLYVSSLILFAYILLYGQYYNWFKGLRITLLSMVFIVLLGLFIFRQVKLHRPYINLSIYKYRNFRIGMLLLMAFYLGKGDLSVSYGFFANSVNLDVYHKGYIMLVNGLGIIIGAALTARFILTETNIRLVWLTGFGALLGFHLYMLLILGSQAEISDLVIPLFLQGFGNGTLILSIVLFYVSAVPQKIAFFASVTGVVFRFATFTTSLALISFLGLQQNSVHLHSFANQIKQTNPQLNDRMQTYESILLNNGATDLQATVGANKMLGKKVAQQANLLFVKDYYTYMSAFLFFVMLLIALVPRFHFHLQKIGAKLIPV